MACHDVILAEPAALNSAPVGAGSCGVLVDAAEVRPGNLC